MALAGVGFLAAPPAPLRSMILGARVPQLADTSATWQRLADIYASERYLLAVVDQQIRVCLHALATYALFPSLNASNYSWKNQIQPRRHSQELFERAHCERGTE